MKKQQPIAAPAAAKGCTPEATAQTHHHAHNVHCSRMVHPCQFAQVYHASDRGLGQAIGYAARNIIELNVTKAAVIVVWDMIKPFASTISQPVAPPV